MQFRRWIMVSAVGCVLVCTRCAGPIRDNGEARRVWVLRGGEERLEYVPAVTVPRAAIAAGAISRPEESLMATDADENDSSRDLDPFAHGGGSFSRPPALPPPDPRSTIGTNLMGVEPRYWYKQQQQTSLGLERGSYREGHYTPGFHTSSTYVPGHYRSEGVYTRGQHTTGGYIHGDYRSVPIRPLGAAPAASFSPAPRGPGR